MQIQSIIKIIATNSRVSLKKKTHTHARLEWARAMGEREIDDKVRHSCRQAVWREWSNKWRKFSLAIYKYTHTHTHRSEMKPIITNTKNCAAFSVRYTLFSRFYYVTMYSLSPLLSGSVALAPHYISYL